MGGCLSTDQLAELLNDRLGERERATLEAHLGGCAACQQALLHLAGDATFERWRPFCSCQPPTPTESGTAPPAGFLRHLKEALLIQQQGGRHSADELEARPAVPGFEVLDEIGRGGMAVVYKARQKGLDRLVALKIIHACAGLSSEGRNRARRGAEMIAHLQHPNIVQIFEVGEYDGRLYGVLEYLEGGSLNKQIHGTPWLPPRAAQLVKTLAEAVHAVHQHGIIHRDLKPSNVLLTAEGTPKIADFGLAKYLEGGTDLTQSGDILGTPSYMAPEQASGKVQEVGPAVDIYGVGAILYELLTGRPPFHGTTPLDTLQQVVHEEPVPPARLQPKVPRDLQTICLKCLQKEPRRRYTDAAELASDLGRFLAGAPIRARPTPAWERSWKWVRQRPAVAGLLLLLVLVALLGIAGVTLEWYAAKQAHQVERQRRQEAEVALDEVETALYESCIALARARYEANDVTGAREALTRCLPRPGRPDRRTREWYDLWRLYHRE